MTPRRARPSYWPAGMFITAVRDGYLGRWQFLEATLEP
jgi:hypothetical protein